MSMSKYPNKAPFMGNHLPQLFFLCKFDGIMSKSLALCVSVSFSHFEVVESESIRLASEDGESNSSQDAH